MAPEWTLVYLLVVFAEAYGIPSYVYVSGSLNCIGDLSLEGRILGVVLETFEN